MPIAHYCSRCELRVVLSEFVLLELPKLNNEYNPVYKRRRKIIYSQPVLSQKSNIGSTPGTSSASKCHDLKYPTSNFFYRVCLFFLCAVVHSFTRTGLRTDCMVTSNSSSADKALAVLSRPTSHYSLFRYIE